MSELSATVIRVEMTAVVAVIKDGQTAGTLQIGPAYHYPANPLDLAEFVRQVEAQAPQEKLVEAVENGKSLKA